MKPGDIVSHAEICVREHRMLQHGMNFRISRAHSVVLMSQRRGAPYADLILDGGRVLVYEGHDVPRRRGVSDPKEYDQPTRTASGKLTPNGKFEKAALDFKSGRARPEHVRVYEKIREGIWTYNGVFLLVDVWQERSGTRKVFKFKLKLAQADEGSQLPRESELPHNRLIPTRIKREVYKRDRGRCVICGGTDNLHFDHDFPYSKGGTSLSVDNIRLLCVRHNLQKGPKIE